MKLKLKHIAAFALAGVLGYTSCQKTSITKTPVPVDYNALASQIALSLNSSLTGQYGGTSINDGVKAPSSLDVNRSTGKALFSLPFCGYKIDTAYSSYTTSGDTTKWLSGQLNFTFTCSSSAVDGYNVYDTLRTQDYNSKFVNDYTNAQNYAFKTIDANSSSLNGSIRTLISSTVYPTSTAEQTYTAMSCYYVLSGLVITKTNGVTDVTSGSATFTSKTSEIDASTGAEGLMANYTGSMTWIGNHKADLTIDPGHKYVIDFTTKTITPAQ